MSYGEIKVTGDDVFEALTYVECETYTRRLNTEGEQIADLIIERVMDKLTKRLATKAGEQ